MQVAIKEWLVRTQTHVILGPYTERELLEELKNHTFGTNDEICRVGGPWFSAANISNREFDDLTHTSTRNDTFSGIISTPKYVNATPKASLATLEEEITPTPDAPPPKYDPQLATYPSTFPHSPRDRSLYEYEKGEEAHEPSPPYGFSQFPQTIKTQWNRTGPLTSVFLVLFSLWAVYFALRTGSVTKEITKAEDLLPLSGEGEDPFVRKMYSLIHMGLEKRALQELSNYDDKKERKEGEYLVPYAALLITQKESSQRAKKILDSVLSSDASPKQKARAHHWLGYLLLSQDEGDLGENHFLESLQLNPKDAAARFNLGRCYLRQEKFSQALDYLQLAELELPNLWLVHIYKGRAKAALGSIEEARHSFKTAIKNSPDRWLSYVYYSLFLMSQEAIKGAQEMMYVMLSRDPLFEVQSPAPWGFFQEKINYSEYFNAFSEITRKGNPPWRELGRNYIGYLLHGPNGNEVKRINALAEKGDDHARLLQLRILLERSALAQDLRVAVNRLNPIPEWRYLEHILKAEAYMRLTELQQAEKELESAVSSFPQSATARWAYANLLRQTGRPLQARSEIKSLLTFHPNYIPAVESLTQGQNW